MKQWFIQRSSAARHHVGSAVRRFGRDRRGGTAVQALVLLPVFILLLVTLITFWRVILVRRSLHSGVYEATRFLSLYPLETNNQLLWQDVARVLITTELMNNPFVRANLDNPSQMEHGRLDVRVDFPDQKIECKAGILLTVDFRFPLASIDPFPGPQFTLHEIREGEILCD